jgi:hypothetical protein
LNRKIPAISAVVIALSVFTAGCDSAKQYATFAQLGSTYAAAIDRVLLIAGNLKIDATSEQLLADKRLAGPTLASYRAVSAVDEDRLKVINQLRAHVHLMGLYLSALNDLATSTAPDTAATAASGAAQGLEQAGFKLRAGNVVSPIAKIVVASVIRGALRRELEARQVTIRTELTLQEKLIDEMAGIVQHDVGLLRERLENRVVIGPLVAASAIADPDQWVFNRRIVLNLTTAPQELQIASTAVKKLRLAFENLIEGKLTADRVNSVLTDFNAILAVGDTLKKDLGGKS